MGRLRTPVGRVIPCKIIAVAEVINCYVNNSELFTDGFPALPAGKQINKNILSWVAAVGNAVCEELTHPICRQ